MRAIKRLPGARLKRDGKYYQQDSTNWSGYAASGGSGSFNSGADRQSATGAEDDSWPRIKATAAATVQHPPGTRHPYRDRPDWG